MPNQIPLDINSDPKQFETFSRYDDLDSLVKRYFELLFYIFNPNSEIGIEYFTHRNNINAKIVLEEEGFINYTQSSFCTWNKKDPKYRRKVSPSFVLFMFTEICCINALDNLRTLQHISDETDEVELVDYNDVIKNIDDMRKNKITNIAIGSSSNVYSISDFYLHMYELIKEFFCNIRPFYEKFLNKQKKEYDSWSDDESEEENKPKYDMLTLGKLINFIREQAAEKLREERIIFERTGEGYDNPIKVVTTPLDFFIGYEEKYTSQIDDGKIIKLPIKYESDDESVIDPRFKKTKQEFTVIVDYSDAKEFESEKNAMTRN